jgi:hypothetical protein
MKNFIICIILCMCFLVNCKSRRTARIHDLTNTYFNHSMTKMQLYYYSLRYRKNGKLTFAVGIRLHFKPDSTFVYYSCDPNSPFEGRYQVRQDSIFLDCAYSLLPKQFVFSDENTIIGSLFLKNQQKNCYFICQKDSLSKLDADRL